MTKTTKIQLIDQLRKKRKKSDIMEDITRDYSTFKERWYDTIVSYLDDPYLYKKSEIYEMLKQLLKEISSLPSMSDLE